MRHPPLHGQLIADYVARNPKTQRRGFAPAMREVVRREFWIRKQEKLEGWELEPIGFIPDAFIVDRKGKSVTVVEAEVTSRITAAKWQHIVHLWWLLDVGNWDLWVHTIDRTGAVFSVDTPRLALGERLWHRDPVSFFAATARMPPGRIIWHPGDGAMPEDDWGDSVAEFIRANPVPMDFDDDVDRLRAVASGAEVAR